MTRTSSVECLAFAMAPLFIRRWARIDTYAKSALAVGLLAALPSHGVMLPVSTPSQLDTPIADTTGFAASADGQIIAFCASSSELSPPDTNNAGDVFVRELQGGILTRLTNLPVPGSSCVVTDISADGRFVAFHSDGDGVVADDENGSQDVFVVDRISRVVERVSVGPAGEQGAAGSESGRLSVDARWVVFQSSAAQFSSGSGTAPAILLKDRQTGELRVLSAPLMAGLTSGTAEYPDIAGNGALVGFCATASSLLPPPTNDRKQVLLFNVQTGDVTLVSRTSTGIPGDADSCNPSLSANGDWVAFLSFATNLTPETSTAGKIIRARVSSGELQLLNLGKNGRFAGVSGPPTLSADGQVVLFPGTAALGWGTAALLNPGQLALIVRETSLNRNVVVNVLPEGTMPAVIGGAVSGDGRTALIPRAAGGLYAARVETLDLGVSLRRVGTSAAPVNLEITVSNNGTIPATLARLEFIGTGPFGTLQFANPSPTGCSLTGCNVAPISPGGRAVITLDMDPGQFNPNQPNNYDIQATIETNEIDTTSTNDTATLRVTLGAAPAPPPSGGGGGGALSLLVLIGLAALQARRRVRPSH